MTTNPSAASALAWAPVAPLGTSWQVLSAFGSIPDLSLCVEHGFNFRLGNGSWQQLVHEVDNTWREVHSPANRPTQKPVRSRRRWAVGGIQP